MPGDKADTRVDHSVTWQAHPFVPPGVRALPCGVGISLLLLFSPACVGALNRDIIASNMANVVVVLHKIVLFSIDNINPYYFIPS
jgi:hypothetical protein